MKMFRSGPFVGIMTLFVSALQNYHYDSFSETWTTLFNLLVKVWGQLWSKTSSPSCRVQISLFLSALKTPRQRWDRKFIRPPGNGNSRSTGKRYTMQDFPFLWSIVSCWYYRRDRQCCSHKCGTVQYKKKIWHFSAPLIPLAPFPLIP